MTLIDNNQIEQTSSKHEWALTSETAVLTRISHPQSSGSQSYCLSPSGASLLITTGYIQDKTSIIGNAGKADTVQVQLHQRGYSTIGSSGKTNMVQIQVPQPDGSTATLTWRDVMRALDAVDIGSRFGAAGLKSQNLTPDQKIKILHALAGSLLSLDQQVGKGGSLITVDSLRELGFSEAYADLRDLVRQAGDENTEADQASLEWSTDRWAAAIPDYAEQDGLTPKQAAVKVSNLQRLDTLLGKLVDAFSDALKTLGGVKEVHHDFYLPRLGLKKREAKAVSELDGLVDKVLSTLPSGKGTGFNLYAGISRAEDLEFKEEHPHHTVQARILDKELQSPKEGDAWELEGPAVKLEPAGSLWFAHRDGTRVQLKSELSKLLNGYFQAYGSQGKAYQTVPTGWLRIRVSWSEGSPQG